MAPPLKLGNVTLVEPIGDGGMGVVWRGHIPGPSDQELPVAVKLLTAERRRAPRALEAFRREAQSAARLNHPNIVITLDHGVVGAEDALASAGRLVERSPYLVMELCGSSLAKALPHDYHALRSLLATLLNALAHSHARDVVHRDLKPGNVLLPRASVPDFARTKLADFGLAHRFEEDEAVQAMFAQGGTPRYMAPEQIRAAWRDLGPWTDLYALGVMAYEIVAGSPPFVGRTAEELAAAHLALDAPPLRSRFEIAPGFEDWIRRLLEKEPRRRTDCAPRALAELLALGEPAESRDHDRPTLDMIAVRPSAAPAPPPADVTRPDGSRTASPGRQPQSVAAAEFARSLLPVPSQPPAEPRSVSLAAGIAGMGLGLFGLRTVPLVGRRAEREALWSALAESAETQTPRLVLLAGEAGAGKTRLASWLGIRAHEIAGAQLLRAEFSALSSEPLALMVARAARCAGLNFVKTRARLAHVLGLNEPGSADLPTRIRLNAAATALSSEDGPVRNRDDATLSRAQETGALIWVLAQLAIRRPVVVCLDDVHTSFEGLAFASRLMRDSPKTLAGMVLVLTARTDELGTDAKDALDGLARLPVSRRLSVLPLSARSRQSLVGSILGLSGPLAEQVALQSDGNPLFAVQMVGEWVARGQLIGGSRGFQLAPGAEWEMPESLLDLFSSRCERVLAGRGDGVETALERAAALGMAIRTDEWDKVCDDNDATARRELVESLIRARLALRVDGGWAFAHGLVRESVEHRSIDGGRWVSAHAACAKVLVALYPSRHPGIAARLARHQMVANQWDAALASLDVAIPEAQARYERGSVNALLVARAEVLGQLGIGDDDERRAAGVLAQVDLLRKAGKNVEARPLAQALFTMAVAHGWNAVGTSTLWRMSQMARNDGDLDSALSLANHAESLARTLEDDTLMYRCLFERAVTYMMMGRSAESDSAFADAHTLAIRCGLVLRAASCTIGRTDAAVMLGQHARALEMITETGERLQELEAQGILDLLTSYNAAQQRAYILAEMGRLPEAEQGYRDAMSQQEAVGGMAADARTNLGLLLVWQRRFADAEAMFATIGHFGFTALWVTAGRAACAAFTGRWGDFDVALSEYIRLQRERYWSRPETARTLAIAAQAALEAGELDRAERALNEARLMQDTLGRAEDREVLDALVKHTAEARAAAASPR